MPRRLPRILKIVEVKNARNPRHRICRGFLLCPVGCSVVRPAYETPLRSQPRRWPTFGLRTTSLGLAETDVLSDGTTSTDLLADGTGTTSVVVLADGTGT